MPQDRSATGALRWMCNRWPAPSILHSSTAAEPGPQAIGNLHPQRLRLAAHARTAPAGTRGAACWRRTSTRRAPGSSTPKNVSASVDVCATAPGIRSSSTARQASHVEAAHGGSGKSPAPSRGRPSAYASKAGPASGGTPRPPAARRTTAPAARGCCTISRTVQGHLQGDGGAAGVAGDVRAAYVEVIEQRRRVSHVIGMADGRRGVRAPGPAAPVVRMSR